jgi:hypothetical protein
MRNKNDTAPAPVRPLEKQRAWAGPPIPIFRDAMQLPRDYTPPFVQS